MQSSRKKPTQARSRERLERILAAASELLVATGGTDQLTVQSVAEKAGVPIGSVYQYFSGKSGLLRALAENHLAELREQLRNDLQEIEASRPNKRQIRAAIERIVDSYARYYSTDPTFRIIWGGSQADPELRELDVRDTHENARIFQRILRPYFAHLPEAEVYGMCLLICDTTGSALRLALETQQQSRSKRASDKAYTTIVRELKTMLATYLRSKFAMK